MSHKINFTVEETTQGEHVNDQGEFVFAIYTSNYCDQELERTLITMAKLWNVEGLGSEVTLHINVRMRAIYESLLDIHATHHKMDAESKPLFDALKNDCQWIIDQINKLKMQ